MRRTISVAALSLVLGQAAADPLTGAEIKQISGFEMCELSEPGHLRYAGNSEGLEGCLAQLKPDRIRQLRITSSGGDAWKTLQLAQQLRGRVELLIVDKLCASSCANYLLPAARRVRVLPGSYVLLHGSLSLRDWDARQPGLRESAIAQFRAHDPTSSEQDLERLADQGLAGARDELARQIPIQHDFERAVLACHDWLAPDEHEAHGLRPGAQWLMVTPEMARRCLKTARVDRFWSPESEREFAPQLGFVRARH